LIRISQWRTIRCYQNFCNLEKRNNIKHNNSKQQIFTGIVVVERLSSSPRLH
jgi:hypothetical protein